MKFIQFSYTLDIFDTLNNNPNTTTTTTTAPSSSS